MVAQDVYALVCAFEDNAEVSALDAFAVLQRLFEEQCEIVEHGDDGDGTEDQSESESESEPSRVKVREPKTIDSESLQSPHDRDATYGHKGKGYEVQVSESCEEDNPYQLITATSVGGAHESDQHAVSPMLEKLEQSGMLPEVLLADTGYGSGANIVHSAKRGVDLHAPVRDPDAPPPKEHFVTPVSAQAATCPPPCEPEQSSSADPAASVADKTDEFGGLQHWSLDSTFHRVLACPAGHAPQPQSPDVDARQTIAVLSAQHCTDCELADLCLSRPLKNGDRQLRRAPATIATQTRQAEQQQAPFKDLYRIRSGIESTNQELKGRHGLGSLRIRGKPRVQMSVLLKSLALNVKRAMQWHVYQMTQTPPDLCPAC